MSAKVYDLQAKVLAELLGTMMGIYLGCSVVANALMPKSKGQSMGFGFISLGYGLAFFFPILMFGHVSANLNPAVCLANFILGRMSWVEFLSLSAAELLGAFLGSICTWVQFLPHFKTVPEPPTQNPGDQLLRQRDALTGTAMAFSSYTTEPVGRAKRQWHGLGLRRRNHRQTDVVNVKESTKNTEFGTSDAKVLDSMQGIAQAPRRGFVSRLMKQARSWVSHLKYYTVQKTRFRNPNKWQVEPSEQQSLVSKNLTSLEFIKTQGEKDSVTQEGRAKINTSGETGNEPTFVVVNTPLDGEVAQGCYAPDGSTFTDEHMEHPEASSTTHGNLTNLAMINEIFMQEDLEMRMKAQSPEMYIAAALPRASSGPTSRSGRLSDSSKTRLPEGGQPDTALPTITESQINCSTLNTPFCPLSKSPFDNDGLKQDDINMEPKPSTLQGLMEQRAEAAGIDPQGSIPLAAAVMIDEERSHVQTLYFAAVIADQNMKLSVFTTRPAIYSPPFNWCSEFMATVTLVVGSNLMTERLSRMGEAGPALGPFYIGLYITCLLLGIGGTTGFSVNPARDLGPRIAHALLPIPNKGPSEWFYGWIPVTASFAGGAVGAVIYLGIKGWLY